MILRHSVERCIISRMISPINCATQAHLRKSSSMSDVRKPNLVSLISGRKYIYISR